MRNKSTHCFRLGERASRHSTGWLRAMRQIQSEGHPNDKTAHRLSRNFRTLDDWDRNDHGRSENYRSWKRHSKCRRQWVEHDCPVIDPQIACYELGLDHWRKKILRELQQHETCAFHIADDEFLRDALESLIDDGHCTIIRLVDYGRLIHANGTDISYGRFLWDASEIEIKLATPYRQAVSHKLRIPREAVAEHLDSRRERRKAKQLALKRRRQAIAAVKERRARARRNGHADGLVRPPLDTALLVPPPRPSAKSMPHLGELYRDAKAARLRGISRSNQRCLNLLENYSQYRKTAKTICGLAPYEHDYRKFHNALESCCVWLTGRRSAEFPPWVLGLLTEAPSPEIPFRRILGWVLGNASVRDCYGLSKNEVKEILHLPATIRSEPQAIAAAIARARHCDIHLTTLLAKQTPALCNLFEERNRAFLRNAAGWLNALPAQPTDGKIHDLLDFFFRSGLSENPLFSFKGRTFQRVEALMMQWHQQEKQQAMRHELELHWSYRGYSYQGDGNHVFRELTTGQALLDEGEAQHNCVFSYRHACVSGHTSIVSMRSLLTSARLTIEIDNSKRRIVQIREVCNRLPTNEELRVVRNFASAKNLAISC